MPRAGTLWRSRAPWLLALACYLTLTIVQTWPLAIELPKVLANDLGDPVLNAWIVWWNAHAVPLTKTWWNGPMFWPSIGSLAFSETLLGLAPITSPIQWFGGSAIAAYNVAFLVTFPLSALAMHALTYRLTGRHDAAFIAGLIYGFHPFRTAHFPQIQVMTSYWMPLSLLGLHEYASGRGARWVWISGVAWLMQALSNGYYMLFFPVLAGLWMLWFVTSRRTARTLWTILLTWALVSLPLVPVLWGYRRIHAGYSFQRDIGEISQFGADVVSLLDASPLLKFWRLRSFHQAEGELFPGFTAAILVFLMLVQWLVRSRPDKRAPRTCYVLVLGSLLFIGVALSAILIGPWSLRIGRTTLISVRVVSKPLSIGALLLVGALALEPRFAGAWRRRSPAMFYVLAMLAMYLLCFGPQPRFLGEPFMYRAPYAWLMELPGYDAVRVPARFAMLAAVCLAVCAAFGFARLTAALRLPLRTGLAAVVVGGVLVDSWIGVLPLPPLPERSRTLESLSEGTAVMELPLGDTTNDVFAMYRGMYHRRPIVNGYSGFFPRSYDALRRGLDLRDPQMFEAISSWGPVVVAVDRRSDTGGQWARQLAARPGTTSLGGEGDREFFRLSGGHLPPDLNRRNRLPIQSMSANVQDDRIGRALDGDPKTRWDSGPQRGTEVVLIDLGTPRNVEGLTMTMGHQLSDFPRDLVVESSLDGNEWSTSWRGSTAVVAFAAAVREPRDVPLAFSLGGLPARWIRLRQLGQDPVFYWSIFELAVYGR